MRTWIVNDSFEPASSEYKYSLQELAMLSDTLGWTEEEFDSIAFMEVGQKTYITRMEVERTS